jgi:hypothetical protein
VKTIRIELNLLQINFSPLPHICRRFVASWSFCCRSQLLCKLCLGSLTKIRSDEPPETPKTTSDRAYRIALQSRVGVWIGAQFFCLVKPKPFRFLWDCAGFKRDYSGEPVRSKPQLLCEITSDSGWFISGASFCRCGSNPLAPTISFLQPQSIKQLPFFYVEHCRIALMRSTEVGWE